MPRGRQRANGAIDEVHLTPPLLVTGFTHRRRPAAGFAVLSGLKPRIHKAVSAPDKHEINWLVATYPQRQSSIAPITLALSLSGSVGHHALFKRVAFLCPCCRLPGDVSLLLDGRDSSMFPLETLAEKIAVQGLRSRRAARFPARSGPCRRTRCRPHQRRSVQTRIAAYPVADRQSTTRLPDGSNSLLTVVCVVSVVALSLAE